MSYGALLEGLAKGGFGSGPKKSKGVRGKAFVLGGGKPKAQHKEMGPRVELAEPVLDLAKVEHNRRSTDEQRDMAKGGPGSGRHPEGDRTRPSENPSLASAIGEGVLHDRVTRDLNSATHSTAMWSHGRGEQCAKSAEEDAKQSGWTHLVHSASGMHITTRANADKAVSSGKFSRPTSSTKDDSSLDLIKASFEKPVAMPGPTFSPFTKAQTPPPRLVGSSLKK